MNDQTQIEDAGTALVANSATALARILTTEGETDRILDQIAAEVRAEVPDLTTAKGRKAVASLAYKVARTKTALDEAGKALNADKRREMEAVDAERRKVRERLDALRDEVRAPLVAWERAEEERIAGHKRALEVFSLTRVSFSDDPKVIRAEIAKVEAIDTGDRWDEFQPIAEKAKADALAKWGADLASAEQRVEQERELARLRAEAEERARRDREEAERRAAEEAEKRRQEEEARRAEDAKKEARRRAEVEAEAARKRAEFAAAEKARIEREMRDAAERARQEAEERAAREAKAAEERHQRELAEAKAREEAAAQAERDRIAAERRAEEEARAKRERDRAHRTRIRDQIAEAVRTYADPGKLADAILDGKIPHVRGIL